MTDQEITDESDKAIEAEGEKLQAEADKAKIESEDDTEKNVEEETETSDDAGEEVEEEQEDQDTDKPDIPVRDHIIARQVRTIEKLRSKLNKDESPDDEDTVVDFNDDELTPEASGAVQKEIQRQVAPLIENLAKKSDEDELQGLFGKEPEAKGFEKRIRAYMGHENYQGVPPSVIYHHLAFGSAQSEGAQRQQAADLEAKQMGGAGSSARPGERPTGDLPTADEISNMSEKEFEELEHKARIGGFAKTQQ